MTKKYRRIISKKQNRDEIAPLAPIELRYPFEMMSASLLGLDRCKGGFECVLIVTDHFKRFTQAYASHNKSLKTATSKLFNNFMSQLVSPRETIMIEVLSLETNYLIIWANYMAYQHPRPPHTTR